jgi:hypothetical protein
VSFSIIADDSSGDVTFATITGGLPTYSMHQDLRRMSDNIRFNFDERASVLLKSSGSAWHDLLLRSTKSQAMVVNLANRAIELTAALDQTHRQATGATPFPQLSALNMVFQHDLYAIQHVSRTDFITQAALHALQVYSDVVLWPMPATYGVRERLSRALMRALKIPDTDLAKTERYWQILLWTTVMGAVASEGSMDRRDWYLRRLAHLLVDKRIGWIEFMGIMRSFCWWDLTFAEHVEDIWQAAFVSRMKEVNVTLR